MDNFEQLLIALERRKQILNELERLCAQIEQILKGDHHVAF